MDMNNISWIFDGIGTTIVSLIVGLFIGGWSGYKYGRYKSTKQIQKAGNNSVQTQIGSIYNSHVQQK